MSNSFPEDTPDEEKIIDVLKDIRENTKLGSGNSSANISGTIDPISGSPQIGQPLNVSGTIDFGVWIALVSQGTQVGSRQPGSISNGTWQGTVTPLTGGTYSVQLWTASAGGSLIRQSSSFVVVAPTSPPILTSGQTFSVAENATVATVIGAVAYTGGTPTTWSIQAGDPTTRIAIDAQTGVLSLAGLLDYETVALYNLTVRAENAGGNSSQVVAVNVINVTDTVPVIEPGQGFFVSESSGVGTLVGVVATTGDPATSFSIQSGNTGTAFAISNSGVITAAETLDYETLGSYTLGIRATNGAGNSTTVNINIAVIAATPADTVTTITLLGTGAAENTIVPFAMAFKSGDLPQGTLTVFRRQGDNADFRTQITPLSLHADSSVKHARVFIEPPEIAEDVAVTFNLVKNTAHSSPGSNLDMAALLASRAASITITPSGGGTAQTINLIAALPVDRWIAGPLGVEARIETPINSAAVGGVAVARLVVDMLLTKDGTLTVDVGVRNDACLVAGTGSLIYGISLTVDGLVAANYTGITQTVLKTFQFQRAVRSNGTIAPTPSWVQHNTEYLSRSGAAPNYDVQYGVVETRLEALQTTMNAASWNVPLNQRGIVKSMGTSGERPDIGLVTAWSANWLLSYDPRAIRYAIGTAEASLGIPWNMWDVTNGTWLNSVDRPGMESLPGNTTGYFPLNADPTWSPEGAHHPCCVYIPYLLTGRRSFGDGLMAQASWSVMSTVVGYGTRGVGAVNYNTANGVKLLNGSQQVRSAAWSLRDLVWAGFILSRAVQPHGGFYTDAAAANIKWAYDNRAAQGSVQGEMYGYFHTYASNKGGFAFWQQDYLTEVLSQCALMGLPYSQDVLTWNSNLTSGRFNDHPGWDKGNGNVFSFRMPVAENAYNGSPPFWQTWAEAQAVMVGSSYPPYGPDPVNWPTLGLSNEYGALAQEQIANTRNAQPQNWKAARAWHYLNNQQYMMNGTSPTRWRNSTSNWNVVPYGQTRAAVPPVVQAGQSYVILQSIAVGQPAAVVVTTGGIVASFAITGGNTNGDWSIDNAGVLTPVNALNDAVTSLYNLTITATNAYGTSSGVAVTLDVVTGIPVAPVVIDGLVLEIVSTGTTGDAAGTVTLSSGTTPVTWSITAGNTGTAFAINSSTGQVTQAQASLDWVAVPSYSLTVQATNSAGSDTATVTINPLAVPVVASSQAFDIVWSAANGASAGTVIASGAPTSYAITGGNTGNVFAIGSSGVLTKQGTLVEGDVRNLTITATNAYGTSTGVVVVVTAVAVPSVPYGVTDTNFLGIYELHRVVSSYAGPLIRVRRSSDDAEQDIGISAGQLDEAAVTAFVGASQGFITKVYEQTGLNPDLIMPTSAKQPKITDASGNIYRAGGNNRAVPRFDTAAAGGLYAENFDSGSTGNSYGCVTAWKTISGGSNRRFDAYSTSLSTGDSANAGHFGLAMPGTNLNILALAGLASTTSANSVYAYGDVMTLSVRTLSTTVYGCLNGSLKWSAARTAQTMVDNGTYKVGFFSTSNYLSMDGYWAGSCVFGAHTEADVDAIHAYKHAWLG